MSLKEDLQEIHGIGESKAEEIVNVVESQDTTSADLEAFREGMEYYENGDYEYAGKFFRRVL